MASPNVSNVIDQWEAMSQERLRAAKVLLERGFYRDSISRSYYAAYCAATSRVIGRSSSFANGYRNPSHEQLPDLITNAGDIPMSDRKKAKKLLRALRQAREDADYRPHAFVDRSFALDAIHNAAGVQQILETHQHD